MTTLTPSLKLLRVLAGEGNFHLYRQLKEGRRLFLFAKCLLTTLSYFKGRGTPAGARTVVFVKGANQLRYYQYARAQLQEELGSLQMFTATPLPEQAESLMLPRMGFRLVWQQTICLLMMLITGKPRYLNLYLLSFATAINRSVGMGLRQVESFICFNDQPYDVAAILHALNRRNGVRTIVIQHGLILSENFYFPSVAKEFWAWGELSRQHYRAWEPDSKIIIKGRYHNDKNHKSNDFIWPASGRAIRILVAPSFFHGEVKELLTGLNQALSNETKTRVKIAIKFHPATKLAWRLRLWCKKNAPWLGTENEAMEALADRYDLLITKDSTSAVDFMLRGKPVFFQNMGEGSVFPSPLYGLELRDISSAFTCPTSILKHKNAPRLHFLKIALND
jgi:hypothetical protein